MKFCQDKLKNITIILIPIIILISGILNIQTARAFDLSSLFTIDNSELIDEAYGKYDEIDDQIRELETELNAAQSGSSNSIKTIDVQATKTSLSQLKAQKKQLETEIKQLEEENNQNVWDRLWEKTQSQYKEVLGSSFKAALGNFLNNLAYDTATYLATGDWGQGPMFETRTFSKVLSDAADNAGGTFLETLGKKGPIKFNLCTPDPKVLLKINLGLKNNLKPKTPSCTFSQLTKNWDKALKSKDFLPKFQDMFNPWSNDLGIALTLQTGMETEMNKQANLALEDAKKEYKNVREQISGYIKTPASIVAQQAGLALTEGTTKEKTYTGTLADAIDVFINTLAGKLMDKWLKKGLVTSFSDSSSSSLTDADAQNTGEGVSGAEKRMRSLVEPDFKVRGDYDILAELVTCLDPNKSGPTNCVIDEKFRQAIEKKLTVGQAFKQGYLSNSVFGFLAAGSKENNTPEPRFNEGYPYRSMLILRKFRILPLGWEVAAQKINDQVTTTHTLGDLIACFSKDDDNDEWGVAGYWEGWCDGLVDPNWVLKAPQNFCKKEGSGPEILSEETTGEGLDSSLSILRNDTYCADEQSCIKENKDGSCGLYGYCTEERRKWDFNAKGCEPIDNTCQTFADADNKVVSYLENTLDFSVCNAGNTGCQAYCQKYDYAAGEYDCAGASGDPLIYLNKQAASCEEESAGCHQFIRLNSGGGANLLVNSGFEKDLTASDWQGFGQVDSDALAGSKSLKMNGAQSRKITIGDGNYNIAGESYSLSFYAKACLAGDKFSIQDKEASLNSSDDWQRYNLTYTYPAGEAAKDINFTIDSASCLIDNIKLERGAASTEYTDYAETSSSLIYEKLMPDYLMSACYSDQGSYYEPKVDAPEVCGDYVRKCKSQEAGCELYTNVNSGDSVPAKVAVQDYCPAECVGYDTFIQNETSFDISRDAYFIPKTAKVCAAEAAGCDQFTNLDEVAKGGEGIEYYTTLRQCIKKSENASNCSEFYSWEGSDESGYQLKVVSLKSTGGSNEEPALTVAYDADKCSETVYNLPSSDPRHTDDCRQFYNRQGGLFYRLYSQTIVCSDDCHPYRLSDTNVDDNAFSSTECSGSDRHWDSNKDQCVVCKGGGTWDSANGCVYQAIPGEGKICAAAQNGCREYTGNTGNDLRNIFTDDFNDGTVGSWSGSVTPANESITLGSDNIGRSIKIDTSATRNVGTSVSQGKSYILKFVAKAVSTATELTVSLGNGSAASTFSTKPSLATDWKTFTINLLNLEPEVTSGEILQLSAGQAFFIDNITLTEIVDRYYLVKNSWKTPESCDQDANGTHPKYMLGCDQYQDRAGNNHYLKQFNKLCSESAVGCELMIDTENSTDAYASYYDDGQKISAASGADLIVPADNYSYVVYDSDKQCESEVKGCERLGEPYKYENTTLYSDSFLLNDPDKYGQILCSSQAVGCQTYSYNNGSNDNGERYFKDPGDQVCEYRQAQGVGGTFDWFKKKVKRCGGDSGNVCLTDSDCASGTTCKLETSDNICPTDENKTKTLGLGGSSDAVRQPSDDSYGKWAGICAAADSGCVEHLDPLSQFNSNLIFNGSFADLDSKQSTVADGWSNNGSVYTQSIVLEPNTAYHLGRTSDAGTLSISQCSVAQSLYVINQNNILEGPKTSISLAEVNYDNGAVFYFKANEKASCKIAVTGGISGAVELKEVAVDYQLKQNLDSASCNGEVNFNKGCVLFNQRSQDGSSLKKLDSDADLSRFGSAVSGEDKDSNIILKVSPDRICDKWLACKSYIKDDKDNKICFEVGLCDSVDDKGDCVSFLSSIKANQNMDNYSSGQIGNLSGYAKAGLAGSNLRGDYYPFGAMEQAGEIASIANGGFEYYGVNLYPSGWTWSGQEDANKSWDANIFSVINNPVSAQAEGIGNAPEGYGFLKLGSSYDATSESIDVIPNTYYVLTAYVNTKNLKSGQASVDVVSADDGTVINSQIIKQDLGYGWEFNLGKFKTGNRSMIKVKLYSSSPDNKEGNFYFDDIKIRPALESKCLESDGDCVTKSSYNSWQTPQVCRLYPNNDSLSCDYYEDSGTRQKGWYGYCLEYDRAPGDPNACILWYPVDKVKGDGIEEGAGYQGKIPVYYCTKFKGGILVEARTTVSVSGSCSCRGYGSDDTYELTTCEGAGCSSGVPQGYALIDMGNSSHCGHDCPGGGLQNTQFGLTPDSAARASADGVNWYDYNGDLVKFVGSNGGSWDESTKGLKLYIPETGELLDPKIACEEVIQTVTSVGQNKYWSSRVYKGSDYQTKTSLKEYTTNNFPFGSMYPPTPAHNPYEWDSVENTDTDKSVQPIYFAADSTNAGSPYGCLGSGCSNFALCDSSKKLCYKGITIPSDAKKPYKGLSCDDSEQCTTPLDNKDEIKLFFAKSYGAWKWNGGRYVSDSSIGWGLPDKCLNNSRSSETDFCAVTPSVTNIFISGGSGDFTINNTGLISLTFNSRVDSQQLPLTMYSIDWGDNSKTVVTGVEMRDRPDPEPTDDDNYGNPHSFYHLYSYWDLKAKVNRGLLTDSVCGVGSDGIGYCQIKPKVQIKDNWGWCNNGSQINICGSSQWNSFNGVVVVKEK